MSGALPPVPDLIPISALRKGGVNNNNNNNNEINLINSASYGEGVQDSECCDMGEQRPRRPHHQTTAIDTQGSRVGDGDGAAPQHPATRKTRTERHRKSDRRRERRKRSTSSIESRQPRVNPIFVWVRQKDSHIVEVKCEDYDKRNRILLTKTAQGWRAIPRTETLAPTLHNNNNNNNNKEEEKLKKKKRGNSKIKRKSTAVQVDLEMQQETPTIEQEEENGDDDDDAHDNNKCDVTPLDNLLAVAELEFNEQIRAEQWDSSKEKDEINNMEQLDIFIESCTPDAPTEAKSDECECDYTEEDDNTIAMDDILSRLEQSLCSPDNIPEIIKEAENKKPVQEAPTDLSTPKEPTYDDLEPTDLSVPKCQSPPKRPPSQNSEIQSPQPSGIPAIPQSPDIHQQQQQQQKNRSSNYLESLLSPTHKRDKEPLDLGKNRESDSPKVTCSTQESSEPPAKKIKLEDITLKTLLDKDKEKPTPRLLELLTDNDPITQLKQILANSSLNVPDPMLIPKDKLSQILCSPAKEIPKLLTQRPELRLPEALAYPHLLQDPDILVITLNQLETIVQKQTQSIPIVEKEDEPKKKPPESPKIQKPIKNKPKVSEMSSDIESATNAAFTQMMWLPYLNQLENAAMNFGNNPEFLKVLTSMLPGYPAMPPDIMMQNRVPFPPPTFPIQPNYNPLELGMWQEAMLQANRKSHLDYLNPKLFPQKQNPYLNQFNPPSRNLQIPQFNHPKYPAKTKPKYEFSKSYQQKLYEQDKMRQKQQEIIRMQELSRQQELNRQQELLSRQQQQELVGKYQSRLACKSFAGVPPSSTEHQKKRPVIAMDLSGPNPPPVSKLKVKQHLIDPANATRLLKHDDVPEVGSTTASIEEMQDAQKHLWHPLFGNQKSYTSPWNWTTVTATGE